MKKVFAFVLIAAMVLTAIPMMSFAEELPSMLEYDGFFSGSLDNVFLDDSNEFMGGKDGAGLFYLNEVENTIVGPHTAITITGWLAFDQPILGYGYQIDGGDVIMVDGAAFESEQAVIDAAAAAGCDYSARMKLTMDVSGLYGSHDILPVVKLEDGSRYTMALSGADIEITYDGLWNPDETPSPSVEATPGGSEEKAGPGLWLVFDEDDKYGEVFINGHDVEVGDFDEEKKCQTLTVIESLDPYITINVADAVDEFFGEEVELDVYKYVQFAVRIVPEAGNGNGQLYYTTSEDPEFSQRQTANFRYTDDTGIQIITMSFAKTKQWTGTMQFLRYDVFGSSLADSEVEIYYIAFFETKDAAAAFEADYIEKGADAFPEIATPTPKPTNTPTPDPTATPEDTGNEKEPQNETAAPTVTEAPDNDKKSGCGGALLGGAAVAAMMGAALILLRKKH